LSMQGGNTGTSRGKKTRGRKGREKEALMGEKVK